MDRLPEAGPVSESVCSLGFSDVLSASMCSLRAMQDDARTFQLTTMRPSWIWAFSVCRLPDSL